MFGFCDKGREYLSVIVRFVWFGVLNILQWSLLSARIKVRCRKTRFSRKTAYWYWQFCTKETNTHRQIPIHITIQHKKKTVLHTLKNRAVALSTISSLEGEKLHLFKTLQQNGYSTANIKKILKIQGKK